MYVLMVKYVLRNTLRVVFFIIEKEEIIETLNDLDDMSKRFVNSLKVW